MDKRLDAIAAADAALSRLIEVQAQIDALTAVRTEALAAFDDAFTAAYPPDAAALRERARNAEAACGLRMPEGTVQRLFGKARMLTRELPTTLSGLADGRYSYRHAQALIDETAGLDADDRAAVERVALGTAATTTAAQFRRRVRKLREKRRPETMPQRAEEARTQRAVTLDPLADGMGCLMLYTGAVEAAAIYERVCEAAAREKANGDPRTISQLRADLMVDALLDRQSALGLSRTQLEALDLTPEEAAHIQETELGSFSGIVPTVMVTVPVMTLLGGTEPGMLEGVGPIDAATARRLTAEAPTLYRVLTDPETGISLSMSRTSYRVPDPLRRWLRLRDETCTFAMCGISARRCDIDHTRDWHAHDGPTDHDNLAHLSRGHHTLKHHGGWRVRQDRPGHLTWTSYLGREYTVGPASA
jgi:hypothetical protein